MSSSPQHSRLREETAIAGPSFLGLSDEPPETYSYLLEEDKPRGGQAATYLVILVLLAAVIGGAWKWRLIRDYLASVRKAKPAVATGNNTPGGAQNSPQADASGPPQMTAEAARNPAAAVQPQPAAEPERPAATHEANLGEAPPPKYPSSALAGKAVANIAGASAPPPQPASPALEKEPAASPAANETDEVGAVVPVRPKRTSASRVVPKPANPADDRLLILGENYLYGRTVRRNCAQALVYLKAAASARNPQAMGHLGAMYSIGQCVPRDRPTAYRWFTLAQQADPENPWIERSRQMVWRQMSAAEQQRASGGTR